MAFIVRKAAMAIAGIRWLHFNVLNFIDHGLPFPYSAVQTYGGYSSTFFRTGKEEKCAFRIKKNYKEMNYYWRYLMQNDIMSSETSAADVFSRTSFDLENSLSLKKHTD
jgi:hypothetical protein